jgi:hypothetical protein
MNESNEFTLPESSACSGYKTLMHDNASSMGRLVKKSKNIYADFSQRSSSNLRTGNKER